MKNKVIVVSGFLEAGKTTYIHQCIQNKTHAIRIISLEQGFVDYEVASNVDVQMIDSLQQIDHLIDFDMFDEIYIEYNGTLDSQQLLNRPIFKKIKIKWIHLVDGATFNSYMLNMYDMMCDPLLNSDTIVITKVEDDQLIRKQINQLKGKQHHWLFYVLITSIFSFIFNQDFQKMITIFSGIVIQAIPFLLIGVGISTIIQFYISEQFLYRLLSKNSILHYIGAICISGFLPVCDCAMVPISTRFAQKKVPISQVVVFLLASSSLNPLVLTSTFFAFSNWNIVWLRVVVTILIAVSVAFLLRNEKEVIQNHISSFYCATGYNYPTKNKIIYLLRHIGLEFTRLLQYVLIGAFFATAIQIVLQSQFIQIRQPILLFGLLIVFSMFISVCSTSNAFLAQSFNALFPTYFVILFMCLGAMLDIKNILLLRFGFKNQFIAKYVVSIIFVACIIFAIGVLL